MPVMRLNKALTLRVRGGAGRNKPTAGLPACSIRGIVPEELKEIQYNGVGLFELPL